MNHETNEDKPRIERLEVQSVLSDVPLTMYCARL
jgi:hypothetical protein